MAQEEAEESYLYDFIYLNHESLAFYNAQLDKDGLLTSNIITHSVSEESGNNMGVDFKLFKAGGNDKAGLNKSTQSQFDATAAMPINVLRELNERGLIHTDINSTKVGQIFLFSGRLQITDYELMSDLIRPALDIELGNMPKRTPADKARLKEAKDKANNIATLMEKMPRAVQFRIFDDEKSGWGTISSGKLMINSFDFVMKHTVTVAGDWHVLAVLDALPEEDADNPSFDAGVLKYMTDLERSYMEAFLNLRGVMGRSFSEYGLMPLAIFRKVD